MTVADQRMGEPFNAKKFLATLSQRPGVYRMLAADGSILYVGKALNLKKRVASYFGNKAHHPKTQALMNHTEDVEVTLTATETEALLLEFNLIKAHQPRFNVLLRDGKGYPFIKLTQSHKFPRFDFYRGKRSAESRFFGPYLSAAAVRQTLGQLHKLFRIRQGSGSYFDNRSRPCLQYQIKRCSAPCVGLIDKHEYRRDIDNAIRFLTGKNDAVVIDLQTRMDAAAAALNFELAAQYRDQIATIKDMQARQVVTGVGMQDADALAVESEAGTFCVAVLMIRGGRMLGSHHYFPKTSAHTQSSEVLSAFIAQHYFSQQAPAEILVSTEIDDHELLEAALSERAGRRVAIRRRVRSHRKRWLEMAAANAVQGLLTHRAANATIARQFESLTELLGLDDVPERIECFDISHTSGQETVASCVVFGLQGAVKSAYRRFNIRNVEPGDDYAAIEQAVTRRYKRVLKGEAPLPDLVLIDGGRGQLGKAITAMHELQLPGITLLGVAKGQGRKPGHEKLFLPDTRQPLHLPGDAPALHLIQQIRDEAHRFAITAHRQRRGKVQRQSVLESIPGLGPQRRKALLKAFGGLQGVRRSGIDDLAEVKGISRRLAERIYNRLHGG